MMDNLRKLYSFRKLVSHTHSSIILFVFLASCSIQPVAVPTEVLTPTEILATPIPTSTLTSIIVTPSPLPTQPIIPIITPDSVQVEKWREYENALAMALFPSSFIPGEFLCEWEILGQSAQEVYVWAVCMSIFTIGNSGLFYNAGTPALLHIEADMTVRSVKIPGVGSNYEGDIRKMFPPNVQEKYFGKLIHFQELTDHLQWRREHPNEQPPLIILSAMPTSTSTLTSIIVTPSPLPPQPIIPIITPDSVQAEKWREYENALAMALFPSSFIPGEFLCEWDILGQSDQEIYVWAVCMNIIPYGTTTDGREVFSSSSTPVVIYLGANGIIERVEIPGPGILDYERMFPPEVQAKFEYYRFGRAGEMSDHLDWRRIHPEEPPLIVLSVTPMP